MFAGCTEEQFKFFFDYSDGLEINFANGTYNWKKNYEDDGELREIRMMEPGSEELTKIL